MNNGPITTPSSHETRGDSEHYLARRPDGAYVELTWLLYLLLSNLNGQCSSASLATVIGEKTGKEVTSQNVEYLLKKLLPLGLIDTDQDHRSQEALDRPQLTLGLRVKKHVLPARTVQATTRALQHLFHLPVVVVFVGAFLALLIDMLLTGHLNTSIASLINRPQQTLVVLGLLLVSMVFHEMGHASACRYGGATPGEIGGGLYLMWPALYTNVTDTYRLGRGGRVRTDLGGVYFNAVFCVVMGGLYWVTGYAPLILAVAGTTVLMLEQLLPFVRFDGYWIVSDLAGVPDLFPRLAATLASFGGLRKSRADGSSQMADLHRYSRRIILVWAGVTAIVLPVEMALTLLLSATLFVSFSLGLVSRYRGLQLDIGARHIAGATLDVVQALLLVVMMVGLAYGLSFLTYRICRYAIRRWGRGWWSRVAVGLVVLGVLAAPVVWSATQVRLVNISS